MRGAPGSGKRPIPPRWDSVTGSYDMGFRDYNPGLNRFLTRYTYTGALADLNLGTDPYTGNRYAFAGGNPITGIELDGHLTGAACGPDGIRCGMTDFADSSTYTPIAVPDQPAVPSPSPQAAPPCPRCSTPTAAPAPGPTLPQPTPNPPGVDEYGPKEQAVVAFLAELFGYNDAQACAHRSASGCAWSVFAFFPWGKGAKLAKAAKAAKGIDAARSGRALVDASKFDYLFGNVASDAHNAARSAQNASQLARIGVYDNAAGRSLLQNHFEDVIARNDNIVRSFTNDYGTFQIRDSLFSGPRGLLKFESTWQVTDDGLRLTTVIPMGGP